MKILMILAVVILGISACDRSKGKGSDIEWQQRQEEQKQYKDLSEKDVRFKNGNN